MRDYCTYTVEAVNRSNRSDNFLRKISLELKNNNPFIDSVSYYGNWEGYNSVLEICGEIWHSEVDAMIIEAAEKNNASDIAFIVHGTDYDAEYDEALSCSFIRNGKAVSKYVEVIVNYPEWDEEVEAELAK